MNKVLLLCALLLCMASVSKISLADGAVVDKVYHPYVIANEQEFEWRFTSRQNDDGNTLSQRLAYGHSLTEYITIEAYIIGERDENDNFGLQAYEIEARWMLTDQGRYWADWGMLFEIEKVHARDQWEASTGLLFEKEFARTSLTLNALLIYEWGQDIRDEFESEFRLQYRYRWIPEIQPAIEIYTGEDYVGIGPAFMGVFRNQGQKQLKWELGFIAGLNGDRKDHTLRFALECEF